MICIMSEFTPFIVNSDSKKLKPIKQYFVHKHNTTFERRHFFLFVHLPMTRIDSMVCLCAPLFGSAKSGLPKAKKKKQFVTGTTRNIWNIWSSSKTYCISRQRFNFKFILKLNELYKRLWKKSNYLMGSNGCKLIIYYSLTWSN